MKKLIGVPMWNQGENSVGATKPYLEFLKTYGTVILLSPDTFIPNLDLLVLPGGKDIVHGNGEDFSFYSSDNERFLEHFDKYTLPKYIDNNTSILGICRGFQALMRHFNVPIIPNIWWDHGHSKDLSDTKANKLVFRKYKNREGGGMHVGSWHHQGVNVSSVDANPELSVIAYCESGANKNPDYMIVEYVEHISKPIIGIQSHPERNFNDLDHALIKLLVNRVKETV